MTLFTFIINNSSFGFEVPIWLLVSHNLVDYIMEKSIQKNEQTINEIKKACLESPGPYKPSLLSYMQSRIKYLSEQNSECLETLAMKEIFIILRNFLANKERDIRTTSLKIYRYIAVSQQAFIVLKQSHIEHFLIRSFEVEGKNQERIEACKLIRRWLEISPSTFPKSICNSLIALSEVDNDEFKDFGLEALRLLSSSNLLLVAWSGGLKVLVNSILDIRCSQALSENIIFTLSYLLNESHTRKYLKNGKEVTRILAVFTEQESGLKENELEAVIKLSRKVIVLMSRSWAGLIYLADNGLKDVILNLRHPIKGIIKEGILDTITDMLNIPVESSAKSYNLLNNYLAMLIKALLHCGLYPALTDLAIDKNTRIAQRARKLLKIVTKAASDLLPESPQLSLNLISGNAGKTAELVADIASSARLYTENPDKNLLKHACEFISTDATGGMNSQNLVISGIYKQHFINTIDDTQYLNLMIKCQTSKEVSKWDWDIIYEIISGPISLPSRFIMPQSQKFLKNLIVFFMPSKGLFHSLPWHEHNFIKARVGSMLLSLLFTQEEGLNLLSNTYPESFFVIRKSFVGELNDAIEEEIRYEENKINSQSRVLSNDKVKNCMAREYFKWIGIFLNHRSGRKLLKPFNIDFKIIKIANIEHLSPLLLTVLDYREASSQQFLSLLLQSKTKLIRLKAIEYIRVLFRAGFYDLSWSIWGLVNQMHSLDNDTVYSALSVLDELCHYKENLKAFIETGPQKLMKLGEEGNKCLIRFLSSTSGVKYLCELNFINTELEKWDASMNTEYARIIEEKIEMGLNAPKKTYSLTISTPKVFLHSDKLQTSWISKLPFYMHITQGSKDIIADTIVEIDKEDLYLVGYVECNVETNKNETLVLQKTEILVTLMLGGQYIDSKGNEVTEPVWSKCSTDLNNAIKLNSYTSIENDGIVFKYLDSPDGLKLVSISYKIQVLPKGIPKMQVPRHLFGELGKTQEGINKLKETKYLELYVAGLSEKLPVIDKRAYLWVLGHTGASNTGASYLATIGAIEAMVNVAEKSSVLSLRGTASQALSLVARSTVGRSELSKYSWTSAEPQSASIAVPAKAESIFWIEKTPDMYPYKEKCDQIDSILDEIELNEQEKEILKHICILGSVISKTQSEQYLRNLRNTSPMSYQSLPLFHSVMIMLAGYTFKLQTRRIIHKIFERVHRIDCLDELDNYRYIS